jgi:hypothetical protein
MAKKVEDYFLDAYLNKLDDCTTLHVTSAEPANHAGIAAVSLASVAMTAGAGNSDYTIANGDVSGRKLTVVQQSSISITGSGTATHVVLTDATNIWCTTCTSQALTAGGTVTVNAFDVEIADPT